MTRMTGPDCAVMCNLINTHTHTHIRDVNSIFDVTVTIVASRVALGARCIVGAGVLAHVFFGRKKRSVGPSVIRSVWSHM